MGIDRKFVGNTEEDSLPNDGERFRVMTFNVLAQGLSRDSFVRCPSEALDFDRRVKAIVDEISNFSADLLCLQEVDMYDHISSQLKGYGGFFKEKTASPCLYFKDNIGPDGSAVLFKSAIKCESQFTSPLKADGKDCNQLMIASRFTLPSAYRLLLVCLHLKAKQGYAQVRAQQMEFVLNFVKSQHALCDGIIIAGDLNSAPTEPAHELLESQGYMSSYVSATRHQPEYTTCKIRLVDGEEVTQRKVEDYIYYKNISDKKELKVVKVLEVPEDSMLGEGRLPSMDYPSDHLSMVADFCIY